MYMKSRVLSWLFTVEQLDECEHYEITTKDLKLCLNSYCSINKLLYTDIKIKYRSRAYE